jgi:hypothetical protein
MAAREGHAYALRELAIHDLRRVRGVLWIPIGIVECVAAFFLGIAIALANKDLDLLTICGRQNLRRHCQKNTAAQSATRWSDLLPGDKFKIALLTGYRQSLDLARHGRRKFSYR